MTTTTEDATSGKKIAIIGAGLVGALNACYFAQRGYEVYVFESRSDPREEEIVVGRSINLSMSHRGRQGLSGVGLEEVVIKAAIPMYGRMIHDLNGKCRPIPYGKKDQCIMAVDRRRLNEILIEAAEAYSNVKLHFDHKLGSCDLTTGSCSFYIGSNKVTDKFDLIVGNDGAFSAVRREMIRQSRFQYSQEYISHGYLELRFPVNSEGKFCMETNFLHIWPREDYMLIALPNPDGSFTGTLFMPFQIFEDLTTEERLMTFFDKNFPDAVDLLGRKNLVKTYFANKPNNLISVKCQPYHLGNKAVIMGDAAHAMVPFYGQGMNCGFEDVLIFHELLDRYQGHFGQTLREFSRLRCDDDHAINDLAMDNYVELRKSVNSRIFLLRKALDSLLHRIFPHYWVPLYTMVSFTRIPYRKCMEDRKWQDRMLFTTFSLSLLSGSLLGLYVFYDKYISHLVERNF